MCNGLGFINITTSTALVGYLCSSFSRVLDLNLEAPSSIPAWGELFIYTFPLFLVTHGYFIQGEMIVEE